MNFSSVSAPSINFITPIATSSRLININDLPKCLLAAIFSFLPTELYTTNCFFKCFCINKHFNVILCTEKTCWINRVIDLACWKEFNLKSYKLVTGINLFVNNSHQHEISTIIQVSELPNLTAMRIVNMNDNKSNNSVGFPSFLWTLFVSLVYKNTCKNKLKNLQLQSSGGSADLMIIYPLIFEFQNLEHLHISHVQKYPEGFIEQCVQKKDCKLPNLKYLSVNNSRFRGFLDEFSPQLKFLQMNVLSVWSNELLSNNLIGLTVFNLIYFLRRSEPINFLVSPTNLKYLQFYGPIDHADTSKYLSLCKKLQILLLHHVEPSDGGQRYLPRYKAKNVYKDLFEGAAFINSLRVLKLSVWGITTNSSDKMVETGHEHEISLLCRCALSNLEVLAIELKFDKSTNSEKDNVKLFEICLRIILRIFVAFNLKSLFMSPFDEFTVTFIREQEHLPAIDLINRDEIIFEFIQWVEKNVFVLNREFYEKYEFIKLIMQNGEGQQ